MKASVLLLLLLAASSLQAEQTNRFAERFAALDHDGSGQLDREELAHPKVFLALDENGDGQVTIEEARTSLMTMPQARRRQMAVTLFRPAPVVEPSDMVQHADLHYAEVDGVDPKHLSLDVYTREGFAERPVMVYVHGGGWKRGDKSAVAQKAVWFTSQDWVFVSLNYRLLPEGFHPVNAQDVASAVHWVHENAGSYGGDPGQLLLMGHSAGAHLVSLVATDEAHLARHGKALSILRGVIELDTGALNIVPLGEDGAEFYHAVFGKNPAIWKNASPFHHVGADKDIPPFFLVVADSNPRKTKQTHAMAAKLREAGVDATVLAAPDRTHGSVNQLIGTDEDYVTEAIMEFVEEMLPESKRKVEETDSRRKCAP